MKYLLDTNVFREIGKTSPHTNVSKWLATVDDSDLFISALAVREVEKGVARLAKTKPAVAAAIAVRVSKIFDAFDDRILPVGRTVAEAWGKALAQSEKQIDDVGIAATAKVHGMTVVTRNVEDFRTRGAPLINPFKSPPERVP